MPSGSYNAAGVVAASGSDTEQAHNVKVANRTVAVSKPRIVITSFLGDVSPRAGFAS